MQILIEAQRPPEPMSFVVEVVGLTEIDLGVVDEIMCDELCQGPEPEHL
jgi:hypothetical protein